MRLGKSLFELDVRSYSDSLARNGGDTVQKSEVSDEVRPAVPERADWSRAAAYGLAGLINLVTAGLFVGGLLLVILGWAALVPLLTGTLFIALAVQMRPRFDRLGKDDQPVLTRGDAPVLYALLDEIADAAGVRRVDAVQIGADFAVRVAATDGGRKRVLTVGMPLWVTFTPQQRVAAIAHELAHVASGDVRRGLLVSMALSSLNSGTELLKGREVEDVETPTGSVSIAHADKVAGAARAFESRGRRNWIMWLPGLVTRGVARLLVRLALNGSRHAEYLADAATARVASTRAAISVLHDRHLADAVTIEVHRLAVTARTFRRETAESIDQEFWERVATRARTLPSRVGDSLDTHPGGDTPPIASVAAGSRRDGCDVSVPAALRIAWLSHAEARPATVTMTATAADAIAEELHEPGHQLARDIIQGSVQT
ncbi:M48 family metallopeptidase [Streptomyces sp. NPDC005574]|uniref:M48 family metallopeptidase n=1 Tax=Streptomyces sp. NPDC005574 TaxID=3156891 RepID=UPI00339ED584